MLATSAPVEYVHVWTGMIVNNPSQFVADSELDKLVIKEVLSVVR